MSDGLPDPPYTTEPFDPAKHDREAFSCGVEQVDNFFKRTANKLGKADNARVFVLTGGAGRVLGFYALNSHDVDVGDLPKSYTRTAPNSGLIPAAYLSMIGVDRRYAGRGLGGSLLIDALMRIERASRELGIAVVVLDILDCGDPDKVERRKRLYTGFGFQPFASMPLRMFLPLKVVRALLAGEDAATD